MQDQFCYKGRLVYRTIPPLKAAWNDRIQSTLNNAEKLRTFALARAYIIAQNVTWDDKNNITENKTGLGDFDRNVLRGFEDQELLYVFEWDKKLAVQLTAFYAGSFKSQMEQAFGRLTDDEKADLEMLCFQEANGSARSIVNALSRETSKLELEHARGLLSNSIATLDGIVTGSLALAATFWWNPYISVPALASAAVHAIWSLSNNATLKKVNEKIASKNNYVDTEKRTAITLAANVTNARSTLAGACQALATLKGANTSGSVSWDDVSKALVASKKFSQAELATMKTLYEGYKAKNGDKAASAQDMIGLIATWSSARYNEAADSFASRRQELAQTRTAAESAYKAMYDQFLAGTATEADLKSAAQAAFGKDTMSDKAYFIDMRDFYNNNVFTAGIDYTGDSLQTAASYTGLVQQLAGMRYNMEIATREAEWNIAVKDLETKRQTWNDAARRILEAGLADFDKGYAKIKPDAWASSLTTCIYCFKVVRRPATEWTTWQDKYKEEYERLAMAWDTSYAEMEGKKLAWVGRATKAAESAADSVTLALLGDDAETEARRLDTDIVAELSLGNNAKGLLEEALASASIVNMEKALTASAGSAATVAQAVQTGLGGPAAWNSATISLAAEAFARESNKELAARQAKLMAARLRDQVALMTKGVETSVKDANENTEAGMDSTYLGQGFWSISGNYYVKDVVVHSTVANKYITERASVERFRAYEAPPVTIKTDISDSTLETLQADAIQQLMANVQKEITELMEDIFGHRDEDGELKDGEVETIREFAQNPIWEDYEAFEDQWVETRDEEGVIEHIQVRVPVLKKRVTGYTQGEELWKQEIGAGFFGKYLGAAPITKTKDANLEQGYTGIFEAKSLDGSNPKGEIGRLMAAYIYWSMKEGQGYALAAAPIYDKPIWDSRGSFFQAPSIKDITDIGVSIATTALGGPLGPFLGACLNLVDDAVFSVLDVAGSYKSFGEAGLDFGKKVVASGLNVLGGQAFGAMAASAGKASTLAGKVIGKAVVTGMQGVTMGIMNNAVNSFYWDGSGVAFNGEQFQESTFGRNAIAGYVGSMAGAAFNAGVTPANGFNAKVWDGFMQLGTMAVTEGAKYATQLAYSYGAGYRGGELFSNAWQNHGGITFNLNAGSIMQAAGFLGAINGTGYNAMEREQFNTWSNAFGALGLSMTLGANGVSGRLGSGGYDLVNMGFSMAKGLTLNKLMQQQMAANPAFAEMYKMTYGYGDFAGEETVWRLLLGKDTLELGSTPDGKAQTTTGANGNRIIRMNGTSVADMAVTLQHEAWRDGNIGSTQAQRDKETFKATQAHTQLALALLGSSEYGRQMNAAIGGSKNLQKDIKNYLDPEGNFEQYVKDNYDSSADYWKLSDSGNMISGEDGWLRDANGDFILDIAGNKIGADDRTEGLFKILLHYGLSINKDVVNSFLKNAGVLTNDELVALEKELNSTSDDKKAFNLHKQFSFQESITINIINIDGVGQSGWDKTYTGILSDLTRKILNPRNDPLNLIIPNYSGDGCMARRAIISDYLQKNGFDMSKAAYIDFTNMQKNDYNGVELDSAYKRTGAPPEFSWSFHTAASTTIGGQTFVIDYIANPTSKILTAAEWRKMHKNPSLTPKSNNGSTPLPEFYFVNPIPEVSPGTFTTKSYPFSFSYSSYLDFSRKFLNEYKKYIDSQRR